MKIRFLSGLAGMDPAGALILFGVDDVVDWNDEEAERLIEAGIAEEAAKEAESEKLTLQQRRVQAKSQQQKTEKGRPLLPFRL